MAKKHTKKDLQARIVELEGMYNNVHESASILCAKTFFQEARIKELELDIKKLNKSSI